MRRVVLAFAVLTGVLTGGMVGERLLTAEGFGPSAMVATVMLLVAFVAFAATYALWNTRHRELMAKLWMAVISLTVSYFVLDLAAGYILIRPLSPPLVPDARRHHKLVPDSYSRLQQRDFDYVQRINHLGLRGEDVTVEKPPGHYRILMLGDSFTMGKGVADDETFSVLLQHALNEHAQSCSGRTIEVLNGGVDSYAPILSLIQLTGDLRGLNPDMVVLNPDVSDLVQETAYRQESLRGPDGEIEAVPSGPPRVSMNERIREWAERRLFFTRALLYYTNQFFGYRSLTVRDVTTQANFEVVAHTLAGDTVPRDEQWANIFDSIEKIRAYCEAHGIAFVLSLYPWAHQISDTEWVPGRYSFMSKDAVASSASADRIRGFAETHGIALADVYPAFLAYHGSEPLYFSHDMHWTPAGNRVMAQALESFLMDRYAHAWCP